MARKGIKTQIQEVLDKYFEHGFDGNKEDNENYDPTFSAQNVIDEIVDIVS